MSSSSHDFYANLPALGQFMDLTQPEHYQDAPDDWYVLISDITGSTQAIAEGRYKEVNLLGASSIIAVLNAVAPIDLPFVFGGDGASLLVPPALLLPGREALIGVRHLARTAFKLELRVGAVPVAVIKARYPLKVAKFQLTPQHCQASFIGGGITYAADLLKTEPLYRFEWPLDPRRDRPADLTGMECRWQEIPSPQGQTLSLIVAATPGQTQSQDAVYAQVLRNLEKIHGNAKNYHPIARSALKLTFQPQKLLAEVKARAASPSWWHRLQYLLQVWVENLLGTILMGLGLEAGGVDWKRYQDEVPTASDYQKIDDVLRMVIASTPDRTQKLLDYLEQRHQKGELVYGLQVSDRAVLTCLILHRRDRHLHLVDGADGGYALAAQQLKAQLRHLAPN